MSDDSLVANPGAGGARFAVDTVSGTSTPYMKLSSSVPISIYGSIGVSSGALSASTNIVSSIPLDIAPGAVVTALQLIDDGIYVDNSGFIQSSSKIFAMGGVYQSTTQALADNSAGYIALDVSHRLIAAPGAAQTTQTVTAIQIFPLSNPTAGLDVFSTISLTTSPKAIKNSAGKVYDIWFTNSATSTRWLKFYNASAAAASTGTTLPMFTWGLPGTTSNAISGFHGSGYGLQFSTAISVVATASSATSTDTSAPGTNEVLLMIGYK